MTQTFFHAAVAIVALVLCAVSAANAQDGVSCPAGITAMAPALAAETRPEGYLECIEDEERLAEIQAFSGQWVRCYEAQDVACIIDLYDPNAILVSGGGMPLRGTPVIEAYYAGLFRACNDGGSTAVTLGFDSIETHNNRAVVIQEWSVEATVEGAPVERSGRTMLVLNHTNAGKWKILRQMDAAMMAPPSQECPAFM